MSMTNAKKSHKLIVHPKTLILFNIQPNQEVKLSMNMYKRIAKSSSPCQSAERVHSDMNSYLLTPCHTILTY